MSILTVIDVFYLRFQWVNLQLKHLARMKFQQDIVENLGKLPRSIHGTYSQILTTIRDSANGMEWEVTKRALMWVMCSEELLTERLWTEMTYWPIPVPRGGANILFELCQNLVTLDSRSNVVRFAHLSVQEYLESDRDFTSVAANSMAVIYCLSQLNSSEFSLRNINHLAAISPRSSWITPGLNYATRRWTSHMERVYDCDPSLDRDVLDKLKRFFLPASRAYRNWLKSFKFFFNDDTAWGGNLSHVLLAPTNPLFLAAYFRFGGLRELWECDDLSLNATNENGETLFFVATTRRNYPVMDILLEKGADIYWENSTDRKKPLIPGILRLSGGFRLAASLIDKYTSVIGFAKAMEILATYGDEELVKVVIDRCRDLMITESLVTAAARNRRLGNTVQDMLAFGGYNTRIINYFVEDLARRSTQEPMGMLLASFPNLEITETVMIAAAENQSCEGLMSTLLARDTNIPITEAVVTTATENPLYGPRMISMMLNRGPRVSFTEAIITIAVGDARYGLDIICLLLDRMPITEFIVTSAAGSCRHGEGIIRILLDRSPTIPITIEAVMAAADNWQCGDAVMWMLLDRDPDISITEDIMTAAAGNWQFGDAVMSMLLDRDPDISITEKIIKTAAKNWRCGKGILSMLLARNPNIPISAEVVAALRRGEVSDAYAISEHNFL